MATPKQCQECKLCTLTDKCITGNVVFSGCIPKFVCPFFEYKY